MDDAFDRRAGARQKGRHARNIALARFAQGTVGIFILRHRQAVSRYIELHNIIITSRLQLVLRLAFRQIVFASW